MREEGQVFLGWRPLKTRQQPARAAACKGCRAGHVSRVRRAAGPRSPTPIRSERKALYVIRKRFESVIETSGLDDKKFFYFSSLSCRTLVYKGMLTPNQLLKSTSKTTWETS